MPKIRVEHPHSMDVAEVRRRMDQALEDLKNRHDLKVTWEGDRRAKLKRTGVEGFAEIKDNSVIVDLDLSFVLSPLKSKIESRLKEKLAQNLE